MNLILHLIRKDITRSRWALLCWVFSLLYLFVQNRLANGDNWRDYLQFSAATFVVVLGVGLIADIMQADHPTHEDSHWRTLPISGARLVTAKLILVTVTFVGFPLLALGLKNVVTGSTSFRFPQEIGMSILCLTAPTLTLAAAASCTRNVLQCLLFWAGLIFGAASLANYLNRFAPVLALKELSRIGLGKAVAILGLSVVVAVAVILNQYLRRRLSSSVVIMLAGAVAAAVIGVFYGYFYFYHA